MKSKILFWILGIVILCSFVSADERLREGFASDYKLYEKTSSDGEDISTSDWVSSPDLFDGSANYNATNKNSGSVGLFISDDGDGQASWSHMHNYTLPSVITDGDINISWYQYGTEQNTKMGMAFGDDNSNSVGMFYDYGACANDNVAYENGVMTATCVGTFENSAKAWRKLEIHIKEDGTANYYHNGLIVVSAVATSLQEITYIAIYGYGHTGQDTWMVLDDIQICDNGDCTSYSSLASDEVAPTASDWNVTSENIFDEDSTVWNNDLVQNISSDLLSYTFTADESSNHSAYLDSYTAYSSADSDHKAATTETTSHANTLFDDISFGVHYVYISLIDTAGNMMNYTKNITRWDYPITELIYPTDSLTLLPQNISFTFSQQVVLSNISNCSLWTNQSGTFQVDQTLGKYNMVNYTNCSLKNSDGAITMNDTHVWTWHNSDRHEYYRNLTYIGATALGCGSASSFHTGADVAYNGSDFWTVFSTQACAQFTNLTIHRDSGFNHLNNFTHPCPSIHGPGITYYDNELFYLCTNGTVIVTDLTGSTTDSFQVPFSYSYAFPTIETYDGNEFYVLKPIGADFDVDEFFLHIFTREKYVQTINYSVAMADYVACDQSPPSFWWWGLGINPQNTNEFVIGAESEFSSITYFNLNRTFVNNTNKTFDPIYFDNGGYIWNVECCNEREMCSFNSTNYTLSIQDTPPTVTQNSPADGNWTMFYIQKSTGTNFNCSAKDNVDIVNISLYINGILNQTTAVGGTNETSNLWNVNLTTRGWYNWSCEACDSYPQCTKTSNRTLYLNNSAPYCTNVSIENSTTDFCSSIKVNAFCTDLDGDNITVYFTDNHTGNFVNYSTIRTYCYQETANVSTSCGGLDTGRYFWSGSCTNCGNAYDGDDSTAASTNSPNATIYFNYSIPAGITTSSYVQIIDEDSYFNLELDNPHNFTIGQCWNDPLEYKYVLINADSSGHFYCNNGTDWHLLFEQFVGESLYEERMFWDISHIYNYTISSSYAVPDNFSYRFTPSDGYDSNSSMGLSIFEVTKGITSIVLYLDRLSQDRKYELGSTTINITGSLDSCSDNTVWLSLNDPDYGDNYTYNTNSSVYLSYNRTSIERIYFAGDNSQENLTFTTDENKSFKINLVGDSSLDTSFIKINGTNYDGSYPYNVKIDSTNNSNWDVILPGTLIGNRTNQSTFTNNLNAENLSFFVPGTILRYINISANTEDTIRGFIIPNMTLNISGFEIDPEGISFEDKFDNISYSYSGNTCQGPYWIWEDFSKGDVSGRWTGSYTLTLNSRITTNSQASGSCDSGGNAQYSDSDTSNSQTLDLEGKRNVKVKVSLSSSQDAKSNCNAAGGSAIYIYDTTTSASYTLKSVGSGSSFGGTIEIKRDDDYFNIYENGAYTKQISYDNSHDYELKLYSASSQQWTACWETCTGTGSATISNINISGIAGRGNMSNYANCNFTYPILLNSSKNISKAKISLENYYEGDSSDTAIGIYLSNNNGTNWEKATKDTVHVFTSLGNYLVAKVELNTTTPTSSIIADKLDVDVIPGYASGIRIDVAYDGTFEYNYSGNLTNTTSPISIELEMYDALGYISTNCPNSTICVIPIAFSVETAGTIMYDSLDVYQEFSKVYLNKSSIENYLLGKKSDTKVSFLVNSASAGNVTLSDLSVEYKGDTNYTATANFWGNENFSASSDSQIISWRYSPISTAYPTGVSYYNVFPSSLTSKEVQPYGQYIGVNESTSYGMWNITTDALTDPVDIYRWYNPEVNSCLSLYTCKYSNKTECFDVSATSNKTVILDGITNNTHYYLYDFWNLTDCNGSNLFLPGNFTVRGICDDCVVTW